MRRWIILSVAIVALSALIPVVLSNMPEEGPSNAVAFPVSDSAKANPGKALVEGERKFDFGNLSTSAEGEREFVIKNVGTGDLTLKSGTSSCFCTVANFSNPDGTANKDASLVLKPGESTPIMVSWKTKDKPGKFGQRVTVLTSDPAQPEIGFAISGWIYPPIVSTPDEPSFDFGSISNDETTSGRLAIASFDTPDFQVTEIVSSNPDSVSAEYRPLNSEELSQLPYPKGFRVDVTVKPLVVLGEFAEELTIKTDHPKMTEMKVPVVGKRIGPISVAPERIRLSGTSARGGKLNVMLLVREQDSTQFEIAHKPENLQVDIEPVEDSSTGEVKFRRYRLRVEFPPGTPAGASDPNRPQELVLKTDHPKAQSITIPVSWAIMSD